MANKKVIAYAVYVEGEHLYTFSTYEEVQQWFNELDDGDKSMNIYVKELYEYDEEK